MRLSLVSFPIQLYSAIAREREVSLRQIHEPSGERIRYQKVVPKRGPVDSDEIVMGYEYDKDRYVTIDPEELAELRLESSQTLDLVQFVDAHEVDDIYVDRPYYVAPGDRMGEEAFRVVRTALKETRKAALGQIVLSRRERLVAIRPCGRGMVLETLRYAEELREAERIFDDVKDEAADEDMIQLAKELIERKTAAFEPDRFQDRYETALRELIQAKLRGKRVRPEKAPEPEKGQVINLMDALKASVKSSGGRKSSRGSRSSSGRGSSTESTSKSTPKSTSKGSSGKKPSSRSRKSA
jgi:DNA end-binding protein Ku